MERDKRQIIQSRDNDLLPPSKNESFVIGYGDEANGEGVEGVAEFNLTRHELIHLVRFWYRRILDIDWFDFVTGPPGSGDLRIRSFATRRIHRAAELIGEPAISKAFEEVCEEFRAEADVDTRTWNLFEKNRLKQWEAVRDKFERASRK